MITVTLCNNTLSVSDGVATIGYVARRDVVLMNYFCLCGILDKAGLLSEDSAIIE